MKTVQTMLGDKAGAPQNNEGGQGSGGSGSIAMKLAIGIFNKIKAELPSRENLRELA